MHLAPQIEASRALPAGLFLLAIVLSSAPANRVLAEKVCLASVTVERSWITERETGPESQCDFNTELVSNILFTIEDNDLEAPREVRFGYSMTVTVVTADEQGTFDSRETQESRELVIDMEAGLQRTERQEEAFAACKFGWKHVTAAEQPVETIEIADIAIGDVVCSQP